MKILFISKGNLPDLQCDTIFHGARSLFGNDFVDINRAWYMYKKDKDLYWNERVPNGGNSYGLGFYLNGNLPEDDGVDRSDIISKIKNKYFDLVIYGSCTRCLDYAREVLEVYPKNKIIFVDGEDDQTIHSNFCDAGHLFKRELVQSPTNNLHPIQFGAPKEKTVQKVPNKIKDYGTVIPGDQATYIFKDEVSYYKDYQDSYFGVTVKKGGWDCGRHYEILMNGCVPFFPDIDDCPENTMTKFPKAVISDVSKILKSETFQFSEEWYAEISENLLTYTKNKLTTEHVVINMLDRINYE
jgi:hypothetical protein